MQVTDGSPSGFAPPGRVYVGEEPNPVVPDPVVPDPVVRDTSLAMKRVA